MQLVLSKNLSKELKVKKIWSIFPKIRMQDILMESSEMIESVFIESDYLNKSDLLESEK